MHVAEQLFGAAPVGGVEACASGDPERDGGAVDGEARACGGQRAIEQRLEVRGVGDERHHCSEAVAIEAERLRSGGGKFRHQGGDVFEYAVAELVREQVVDAVEVVHPERQHAERLTGGDEFVEANAHGAIVMRSLLRYCCFRAQERNSFRRGSAHSLGTLPFR